MGKASDHLTAAMATPLGGTCERPSRAMRAAIHHSRASSAAETNVAAL
jgi:hypothetical protein